ncbi:FMN-dependent dehydrogenase [Thozetella sp. PMI_491]|nr:FMN-dependent dehydrogenase [Thozetella sp. PMI_491]
MPPADPTPITIADIKELARRRLTNEVWEYYITGSDDQKSAERNESIYEKVMLRPRVLRDVSLIDTTTTLLGKHYAFPIAIAPSAYQKLVGKGGEIDVCRASRKVGSNYILSSNATTSMEDVMGAIPPPESGRPNPWFQLYFLGSREITKELIRRAEAAGYEALVLTVDTAVMGNRLHERKHPLKLPPNLSMANLTTIKGGGASKGRLLLNARTAAEAATVIATNSDLLVDRTLVWGEVIPWIRAHTTMKIVIKGILTAEDAIEAAKAGVDAIVVSNHGGRQLDGVPSTLEVLPEVVDAVRGRLPVIFDGGITRGSDVFKALALGADMCLVGRTALWGLAYDGQRGVETALHILERELSRTMALMGANRIKDITRAMLGRERQDRFGIAKL